MTTTPVPDTALKAAGVQVSRATNCALCDADPCGICTGVALAALTVVMPLLGETRTEYTVRVTRDGRSHDLDDNADRDRRRAEHCAVNLRDPWTQTAVVTRTVTTGPWKLDKEDTDV